MRFVWMLLVVVAALLGGCTEDDTVISVNFDRDPIDDLTVTITTPTAATLAWSAPSAGGTTAAGYRIRYRIDTISADTWDEATVLPDPPPPNVPDSTDAYWAVDLPSDTTIALAVRYTQGNGISEMSNVVTVRMPPAPPTPEGTVYLPPGTFWMGSPAEEFARDDDEPLREVTLTRGLFIAREEVNQAQWTALIDGNPSQRVGTSVPVHGVTFLDAIAYCNARSLDDGLTPAYTVDDRTVAWNQDADGWRLPTEAEWEYACRAGADGSLPDGDVTSTACNLDFLLDQFGIYCGNDDENDDDDGGPSIGATRRYNAWGLYDMHGNVYEWCWDWYTAVPGGAVDPTGPAEGVNRVMRGGSWSSVAEDCRSANRTQRAPDSTSPAVGLRVVRTAPR